MSLFVHFLLGFATSFVGTIPPSMLNMTTAKISIEHTKDEALKFAFGVSLIVLIQVAVAIYLAKYLHNNAVFEWYITVFGIIIFTALSIYFFKQARIERKEQPTIPLKNSFRTGILLSLLNMFAIPFYCGVSSTLSMSGWINFEQFNILIFIFGSAIGTYALLYVYAQSAIKIKEKAGQLTKHLNYILSALTGTIALVSLLKIL
ncbi:MAG: LysE family transporter [Flavobacteriaceae bacterium]|nr:LysE family transporter [Flavobacteriaceae bacterium]